jgi:hypothetical protein
VTPLFVLALAALAAPATKPAIFGPATFYGGVMAADLVSTAHFLNEGRCESNGLFLAADGCSVKWGKTVAVKLAGATALTLADIQLQKYDRRHGSKWRWVLRGVILGLHAYAVAGNLRGSSQPHGPTATYPWTDHR